MAQMAASFGRKPVSLRIIAAGSQIQPGSEALYVMPHSRFQTLAELARAQGPGSTRHATPATSWSARSSPRPATGSAAHARRHDMTEFS